VPVVADFRTADRALGGQGAPISPFADWVQHHSVEKRLAILNLGGIANLTLLEGVSPPRAWDCGRRGRGCSCDVAVDSGGRCEEGNESLLVRHCTEAT
jgi:anhydro-N-acetylmuramic acid kinase